MLQNRSSMLDLYSLLAELRELCNMPVCCSYLQVKASGTHLVAQKLSSTSDSEPPAVAISKMPLEHALIVQGNRISSATPR